jgi:hypothetical protein
LVVVISLVSTIVVQNKATPSWSYSGRVEIILGFYKHVFEVYNYLKKGQKGCGRWNSIVAKGRFFKGFL